MALQVISESGKSTLSGKWQNAECFLMPLNASYLLINKGTLLNKSNKEALRSIQHFAVFLMLRLKVTQSDSLALISKYYMPTFYLTL